MSGEGDFKLTTSNHMVNHGVTFNATAINDWVMRIQADGTIVLNPTIPQSDIAARFIETAMGLLRQNAQSELGRAQEALEQAEGERERLRAIHEAGVMLAVAVDAYLQSYEARGHDYGMRGPDAVIDRLARFQDLQDARKRFRIAERKEP